MTTALQIGHSASGVAAWQAAHSTRWPHGMAACVALADMQIWHSGSLLAGGADGTLCSREVEGETPAAAAIGRGNRWQLMLWLPSRWHCMQQCETLPCDACAVCAANAQPGLAHARNSGGGGGGIDCAIAGAGT